MPKNRPHSSVTRIDAAGLADANSQWQGPVSIWIERPADAASDLDGQGESRLLRIGSPGDHDAPKADRVIERTGAVLLPGFVNAHSHLDLTAIGPQPHDQAGGFVPWVNMVRTRRPTDPEQIRAAIRLGVEKSLAGGVVAVGDILGAALGKPTLAGLAELAASPLSGVGFVEIFGIGARADAAIDALETIARELAEWPTESRIRPGIQPHAPNTVSLPVYEAAVKIAARDGLPISTHLAETPEEREFIAQAAGPQRAMLECMGIWDDCECAHIGKGAHPVAHLAGVLEQRPMLAAHVNDATDEAIDILANARASVAYCPRASAYFGAPEKLGPHRFQEMLAAGVNVCLGTDSIINLDTPGRISPLDDARLLARTTDAPARTLLAMLTTRGAFALGLEPSRYTFVSGSTIAGIVAVEVGASPDNPARAVLAEQTPPEILLC